MEDMTAALPYPVGTPTLPLSTRWKVLDSSILRIGIRHAFQALFPGRCGTFVGSEKTLAPAHLIRRFPIAFDLWRLRLARYV